MKLRVKICGITHPEQGQAIAELGADALGFICVQASPRYIQPEQIYQITQSLPPSVGRIGVFANATPREIQQVVATAGLSGVQIHGDESVEFCQQLRTHLQPAGLELFKALRVRDADGLALAHAYSQVVDWLLLDAYDPHNLGGTGKTLDWRLLANFHPDCSWWLAGGLNPENILTAIEQVRPDGVDLSSGVERSPGDKDLQRVEALFQQLKPRALEL